jgi:hypothetical protein
MKYMNVEYSSCWSKYFPGLVHIAILNLCRVMVVLSVDL